MKKTLSIAMIAVLVLVFCSTVVFAATDFKVALSANSTKVAVGDQVEVVVSLKDFPANETGINTLLFTLDYDRAVFETVKTENLSFVNGWGGPQYNEATGDLVIDNNNYKAENHEAVKIKLTVKEKAALGNTTITVKDINGANPSADVFPEDKSIALTITEKAKEEPKNETVKNTVVKEENTAKENPTTGVEDFTVPAILAVAVLGVIAYVRYTRLEK